MISSRTLYLSAGFIALCGNMHAKTVKAQVVALDQTLIYNRLGATQPGGMIFALARDVVPMSGYGNPAIPCSEQPAATPCQAGHVQLRASKRPRPMVLRVNVGDDLEVTFTNLLFPSVPNPQAAATFTRRASLHVTGLEWTQSPMDDGSFTGGNTTSLAT